MDSVPAIFEGGVFKPLQPVSLPERTEVRIPLPELVGAPGDLAAKRREALQRLFAEIDKDPGSRGPDDGWLVANNADAIIYGGSNGPA